MASNLSRRTSQALNESRILVLGTQVLVGAQFLACFQAEITHLTPASRAAIVLGLAPFLLAFALFVTPTAYQQIVDRDRARPEFLRFVTRIVGVALLPLALGLTIDAYVLTAKMLGSPAGVFAAVVAAVMALVFWYGLEVVLLARQWRAAPAPDQSPAQGTRDPPPPVAGPSDRIPLDVQVDDVLIEIRVILPGVQALMGFQFIAVLTPTFDTLPTAYRLIHLASLGLLTLTMIMLMTPAAFHRLVEHGENTARFLRFAGGMVVGAMGPLALGISAEVAVAVRHVTGSRGWALGAGLVALAGFLAIWFGLTLWARARRQAAVTGSPPRK